MNLQNMDSRVTAFQSEKGQSFFLDAIESGSLQYHQLASKFEPQATTVTCGVCSLTILMNTLVAEGNEIPVHEELRPVSSQAPYRRFTQDWMIKNIEGKSKEQILAKEKIEGELSPGISLNNAKKTLKRLGCKVRLQRASGNEEDANRFTDEVKAAFSKEDECALEFLTVNFIGTNLGFNFGGHFSVAGAFSPKDEMILIMDVNAHASMWFWASPKDLYFSMVETSGHNRGYLWVSR